MNRLRELRKQKGMTMKELGKRFNLCEATISNYECGRHEADYDTLSMFADYFGVTVDYILGKEEKKEEQKTEPKKPAVTSELTSVLIGEITSLPLSQQEIIQAFVAGLKSGHRPS